MLKVKKKHLLNEICSVFKCFVHYSQRDYDYDGRGCIGWARPRYRIIILEQYVNVNVGAHCDKSLLMKDLIYNFICIHKETILCIVEYIQNDFDFKRIQLFRFVSDLIRAGGKAKT